MKIGILSTGRVAALLGARWAAAGYAIRRQGPIDVANANTTDFAVPELQPG